MVRTFKIYSSNNFQIYNMTLTMATIMYILLQELIYHIIGSLYTLAPFTPLSHSYPPETGTESLYKLISATLLDKEAIIYLMIHLQCQLKKDRVWQESL